MVTKHFAPSPLSHVCLSVATFYAYLAYNEFNLKNMKIGGYFYAWCEKARLPELRVWIFIAQESIRGFVFF